MAELQLDSRILTITSDASNPYSSLESNSNFVVGLQGATPELRGKIVGVSVESVTLFNLLENVRADTPTQNRLQTSRNGAQIVIDIPGGFYTINTLAATLQEVFDFTTGGIREVQVTVSAGIGLDGGDRLAFKVVVGGVRWILFGDRNAEISLAYPIGIREDINIISDGVTPPEDLPTTLFRTNLAGETAVQLWSKLLVGSRTGLNGRGESTPALVTIPITVPYGSIQTLYTHTDKPTLIYGPMTSQDINSVDVSIRRMDGTIPQLEGTKIVVTLRLFLYSM